MHRQFPQRTESHQLEELSERYFVNSLPRSWRCEKPSSDYGVDLRVHIFEDNRATGLELLVQLKASQTAPHAEYVTVRLKVTTYNLLNDVLPVVMLVKYIEDENEAYWLLLREIPKPNQDQQTFTVRIPKRNRLSLIDWNLRQEDVRRVTDRKLAAQRRSLLRSQGRSTSSI